MIKLSKNWKPGNCQLCGKFTEHLERHHIKYRPEVTIDLCHNCHFLCHYFPNRLKDYQKIRLLNLAVGPSKAYEYLKKYGNNVVALAKLIAPSRREHIHKAQREEQKRI